MQEILFNDINLYLYYFIVGGNANFKMENTAFTIMGFTQPQAALPVIQDQSNNAKGFTSRFLWYFPEPVFCKMCDNVLSGEETQLASKFRNKFGKK